MADHVEQDDDDNPFDFVLPPGPSPIQLGKEAAEFGDVDYFLDIFRTQRWSMFSIGEMLR